MEHRRTPTSGRTARRSLAAVVAALALVGAGACSSDDGGGDTADTTTTSTTVATTSTTATPASTAATTPTTARPSPASLPLRIPVSTDGTSPDGDGCAPAEGDALPDGLWFGTMTVEGDGLVIDLACFYTGEAADAAALADDPAAEVPVPNDYYVSDQADRTYPLPLDKGTLTLALDQGGTSTDFLAPAPDAAGAVAAVQASTVPFRGWVLVLDGVVTVVQQQYLP